jgi:hypothetical protein
MSECSDSGERLARTAEVRRVLDRYLIEVVESWNLCPWARGTRQNDELRLEICWGPTCEIDTACELVRQGFAACSAKVVMLVCPELRGDHRVLTRLRDGVARQLPDTGVAAFGPAGTLDLRSPGQLVPLLRRSPDPMLQLMPFSILDPIRSQVQPLRLTEQLCALTGQSSPPPPSVAEAIALRNHAAVIADHAQRLLFVLADIAADRARSYARLGIHIAPM